MGRTNEGLEHYAEQLTRLLAQVGTVDVASEGFQVLVAECGRCASGLRREVQRLNEAPDEDRELGRKQLRRLASLHAMVEDAVRREQRLVAVQLAQARSVRDSLDVAVQLGETGESCDMRG